MDMPVLVNQQRLSFNSFVWTLDDDWRTNQEQWMIGLDGKRESGKSVMSALLDDDDDDDDDINFSLSIL